MRAQYENKLTHCIFHANMRRVIFIMMNVSMCLYSILVQRELSKLCHYKFNTKDKK